MQNKGDLRFLSKAKGALVQPIKFHITVAKLKNPERLQNFQQNVFNLNKGQLFIECTIDIIEGVGVVNQAPKNIQHHLV